MVRWLVVASLIAGCNPPEGRDRTTLLLDLDPLQEGGAAAAIEIAVSVDETARGYENTIEVDIGGLFPDGEALDIGVVVLAGLSTVAHGSRTSSEHSVDAVWTPDFDGCEGLSFAVRDDEGCDYTAVALLAGDRVYSLVMGFTIKSQAPKGAKAVDVEVTIDAEQVEPQ